MNEEMFVILKEIYDFYENKWKFQVPPYILYSLHYKFSYPSSEVKWF